MNKSVSALERRARAQGWRVERTRSGHLRWYPPPGGAAGHVTSSSTPSDPRTVKNIISNLRKKGFRMSQDPLTSGALSNGRYLCLDCGYEHPYEEMMRVPRRGSEKVDAKPTQFCKKHFAERRVKGRNKQLARDQASRETTAPQDEGTSSEGGLSPGLIMGQEETSTAGTERSEPMGQEQGPAWEGESEKSLEQTIHEVAETLLGGLADLEQRVDERLCAIEQVADRVQGKPAATPRGADLALTLHRFSQQILWLGQFDDAVLPVEKKQQIATAEASKLATKLSV